MSRVGSDLEDDNLVNRMLQQLAEQAQDCSDSLDRFTAERSVVLNRQKKALAEYEEEMRALERLENGVEEEVGGTQPYLDPNILKHLNVDKQSDYYKNLAQNLEDEEKQSKEGHKLTALDFASLEKKGPAVIEIDHRPKPSFEEKKKMRETMFLMLEEASIEETRLELAYEEAKESGDMSKASELGNALYYTQRMNADRLTGLISDYRPEPFTKNWGTDPDYVQLMKQLHNILPAGDSLDEVHDGGKKNKNKNKK